MIKINKQIKNTYSGLNDVDVKNSINRYGSNIYNKNINQSIIDRLVVCLSNPGIIIICLVFFINIIFIISKCYWFEYIGVIIVLLITMILTIMFRYALSLKFKYITNNELKIIKNYVWRNKHLILIPESQIVVGDFVQLYKGDILPADGILIKGNLVVNQYMLNNNVNDITKKISIDEYNEYDMEDGDLHNPNMLFKMSIIDNGTGTMLVTRIGKDTYFFKNKYSIKLNNKKVYKKKLSMNVNDFVVKTSKLGYMLAFFSMLLYLYNCVFVKNNFYIVNILSYVNSLNFTYDIFNSIVLVLVLILILVPEELKSITKIIFSLNFYKILKNNIIFKNYEAIEDLNYVDYLFINEGVLDYSIDIYDYIDNRQKNIRFNFNNKIKIIFILDKQKKLVNEKSKFFELVDNENNNDNMLSGDEILKMSEENIIRKLNNTKFISKVNFNVKEKILKVMKNKNYNVALVINRYEDVEILKQNNVIVSLDNINYIKKCSDIILKDKKLTSLFKAFLYSKLVSNTVKKIILFKSIVCCCLAIFNIISIFANGFLAINIMQMLWINLMLYFIIYLAYTNNISCENIGYKGLNTNSIYNLELKFYTIIFSVCFILFSLLYFNIPLEENIFRLSQNKMYLRTGYFNIFAIWILLLSIIIKLYGKSTKLYSECNYIFIFIICFIIVTQVFVIYFENFIFNIVCLNILELKFSILFSILIILFSIIIIRYLSRGTKITNTY